MFSTIFKISRVTFVINTSSRTPQFSLISDFTCNIYHIMIQLIDINFLINQNCCLSNERTWSFYVNYDSASMARLNTKIRKTIEKLTFCC